MLVSVIEYEVIIAGSGKQSILGIMLFYKNISYQGSSVNTNACQQIDTEQQDHISAGQQQPERWQTGIDFTN